MKSILTIEERTALFNEGVVKLSKKLKIGVVPKPYLKEDGTIGAQAHLIDLIQIKNGTTE